MSWGWFGFWYYTSHYIARDECISNGTRRTTAHRCVIDYVTQTVLPAGTWAWIYAFVPYARSVSGAICAEHTFRPAADVRVAKVFGYAGANTVIAPSVGPAG